MGTELSEGGEPMSVNLEHPLLEPLRPPGGGEAMGSLTSVFEAQVQCVAAAAPPEEATGSPLSTTAQCPIDTEVGREQETGPQGLFG